jgi:MFS transporter, DHA1 family, inner membrane transport protein
VFPVISLFFGALMAFLRNDAINRVNLHSGIHALAQGAGAIFFMVFLVRAGVPIPVALAAQAAIVAVRFVLRPLVLPVAKRLGLKPLLIAGTLGLALQYPVLAEVRGIDGMLAVLVLVTSLSELVYYVSYNAYFAALGDAEHRGHQISAREALMTVAGIVAPLLGTWALVTVGPRIMFAAVAMVQALAVLPIIGAPNVQVKGTAPGAYRSARVAVAIIAADGWFDVCFIFVWQIALFVSLGENFAAYGGAMVIAGLVGAIFGLLLGRHIDAGHGRRAVMIAYGLGAAIVLVRAGSLDWPWIAVVANGIGGFFWPLMSPTLGVVTYNLAKASQCPLRFNIAMEGGWDIGCCAACLVAAGLISAGVSLAVPILLALPAVAVMALLLWQHYPNTASSSVSAVTKQL